MQKVQNIKSFFGCNTPLGFKGFLKDLYDPKDGWQIILIKGAPGSGKNTILKKALAAMRLENEFCEEIYCSSDPSSLDGIIVREKKKGIFDATSPHIMEPLYWGASEILLDLSIYLDMSLLSERAEEIIFLTDTCSELHRSCCTMLSKAAFIQNGILRSAESKTDYDKIIAEANSLSDKLFKNITETQSFTKKRFLSAVTPEGNVFFKETLDICDKVYTLYDPFGAFSSVFLSAIYRKAQKSGEEFFAYYCPLSPDMIEHIIFPRIGIGFTTLNDFHRYDSLLRADYSYLDFAKGEIPYSELSCRSFTDDASKLLLKAKKTHDDLETLYSSAMDWNGADKAAEKAVAFLRS